MLIPLHQLAAALYVAAGIVGGISLASTRSRRPALWLLTAATAVHAVSFAFLHRTVPTPQLTDLPAAASLMACLAMASYLAFARRARWDSLVVFMAPIGFLGAFVGALRMPHAAGESLFGSGSLPHAHVVLASAGLALLGIAGVAGMAFLREAGKLKRKQKVSGSSLPSLETLDRVNLVALAVGFLLLTLGVLSGMLWLEGADGRPFSGSAHEIWTTLAWAIYAVLVIARFGVRQSARSAALSAVGGFVFLLFAVIGIGVAT